MKIEKIKTGMFLRDCTGCLLCGTNPLWKISEIKSGREVTFYLCDSCKDGFTLLLNGLDKLRRDIKGPTYKAESKSKAQATLDALRSFDRCGTYDDDKPKFGYQLHLVMCDLREIIKKEEAEPKHTGLDVLTFHVEFDNCGKDDMEVPNGR